MMFLSAIICCRYRARRRNLTSIRINPCFPLKLKIAEKTTLFKFERCDAVKRRTTSTKADKNGPMNDKVPYIDGRFGDCVEGDKLEISKISSEVFKSRQKSTSLATCNQTRLLHKCVRLMHFLSLTSACSLQFCPN